MLNESLFLRAGCRSGASEYSWKESMASVTTCSETEGLTATRSDTVGSGTAGAASAGASAVSESGGPAVSCAGTAGLLDAAGTRDGLNTSSRRTGTSVTSSCRASRSVACAVAGRSCAATESGTVRRGHNNSTPPAGMSMARAAVMVLLHAALRRILPEMPSQLPSEGETSSGKHLSRRASVKSFLVVIEILFYLS